MLKKIVLGSLIAGGLAFTAIGTSAVSYFRTGVNTIRQEIQDQIPISMEIKRARDMICNLKPEIASNLQCIAREEVEVSRISKELKQKNDALARAQKEILRLKDDVADEPTRLVYAGREYSLAQVKDDLHHRFKQFQTQQATADKLQQVLSARERNLDAARRKLDEMLAAKRQLEIEVENLQARMTMVEVAETSSSISFSDSQLSQTRRLLNDIATRIEVAERMVDSEVGLEGSIPLEEVAPEDIVEQVTSYFEEGKAEIETFAVN